MRPHLSSSWSKPTARFSRPNAKIRIASRSRRGSSTGKTLAGGRKHRRWRLVDKGCYATTADTDEFGKGLAAQGFWQVGLHHAGHVLSTNEAIQSSRAFEVDACICHVDFS